MKTLLEKIEPVDYLIRQLHKIDSKLLAGQIIMAWREIRSLTAMYEDHRKELLKEDGNGNTRNNTSGHSGPIANKASTDRENVEERS